MSTARVGIQLDLMGGKEALSTVERLERELKSLAGSAFRIRTKSDIKALKRELDRIKGEKAVIQVETKSAESKIKRLERSAKRLKQILSTKQNLQGKMMDPGQLRKVEAALREINKELGRVKAQKINLGSQFSSLENQARAARQQINLTREALQNVKPIGQVFTSASSKVSHLGSAFQSLGAAMNRIYQPVRWLLNGTLFAAGYKLMNMAHEGLASSLERYDTMENYAKSMAALGEDANRKFVIGTGKAMTAVENLNEAVLGLPTGLNEIVDMQKRFYSSTNDMVKSTEMAIATNNAFLASGTQASEKLFGERQLRTLMSVGKLTSMQWASLQRTMPLALDVVAKELGYADKGVNAMTQDINSGKIAVDDFVDTLIRLGTSGTIADAANVMKHSFQGVQSNIQNAFSRMGYNIMKTLDEVFQKAYGKDTIDMMYGFRDLIDKASEGIQNWIKSDPDFFIDTLERIKNLDWKGFAKGFGEGLKTAVDWILKLGEAISNIGAEKVGKFMALSGMIASGLSVIGGVLRGGRFAFGLGAVGAIMLLRTFTGGGLAGKAFGKMKGMFKGIKGVGKEAKAADKATKGGAIKNLKGTIGRWAKPMLGIAGVLGTIAATAGTIMISTKAIKEAIKDMKQISNDFGEVDWGVMAKVMTGFGTFVGATALVGRKIGKLAAKDPKGVGFAALGTFIAGAMTSMVAGFGRLDIKLVKDSIKDMVTITDDAKKLGSNVNQLKNFKVDKESAKNLASTLYGIYEAMFNRGGESLSDIKKGQVKKAQEAIKSLESIFTTIKSITDTLPQMYESLRNASIQGAETQGRGATPFTNFKVQIQTLFKGINQIMSSLNEDLLGGGEFNVKQMGRFDSVMESVKNTFASIKKLTDGLPGLYESMNAIMGGGGNISPSLGSSKGLGTTSIFGSLTKQIKSLFKGLGDVFRELNGSVGQKGLNVEGMEGKLESIANSMESVRKIVGKLNKLGGKGGGLATNKGAAFTAIKNIKSLIGSLKNALGGEDLGGLKSAIDTFVSSVKSLLAQLDNIAGVGNTVEVKITIKGTVKENVTKKIKEAMDKIKKACRSRTFTKHVYIKIQRHVSIGGDSIPTAGQIASGGGGGGGGFFHTGGYVKPLYRAKGGDIFKPKGTDIVPAMLSHGEFVQKRAAVDFWGVRFMQKINNLDINGVMRELSARANHYMNINRGTTINNNTTNNTDFTQNVYTSNPNFAFKRSSRYVGAL